MPKIINIDVQNTICDLYKMGKQPSQIARLFNISSCTVSNIVRKNNIPVHQPKCITNCYCDDNFEGYKTLLKISRELGYTKNAVKYHVRCMPKEMKTQNKDGLILISPEGVKWLAERVGKKQEEYIKNYVPVVMITAENKKQLISKLLEKARDLIMED